MKIRAKHRNNITKIAFLNDCICSLPLQNEGNIREHIEKFKRYLDLDEKKKMLVIQYKEVKDMQKKILLDAINREDQKTKEKLKAKKDPKKEKEEREKIKDKIKNWKVNKVASTMVEKENDDHLQLEIKKGKEDKNLVQKDETLRKIQEYKEQKEMEKIRKKEKEEYEKSLQKRNLTQDEFIRIKEKEDELLKKKQDRINKDKLKKNEYELRKQKLLENASLNFAYVDSKLTETTKATLGRQRDKFDPRILPHRDAATFGGSVTRTSGRAIPNWRMGAGM